MTPPDHFYAMTQASETYLQQAMAAHQRGDLFEADMLYARTLEQEPENLQALRLRGILARERGAIDNSLELLRKTAELCPADPQPLSDIAITLMAGGNLPEAEMQLRQALELAEDSPDAQLNLGAILHQRGHLREAIALYRQALTAEPDDLAARCNLAKALSDAGRFAEALSTLDTGPEPTPSEAELSEPVTRATRGAVLLDQRDYPAVRAMLEPLAAAGTVDDMTLVNLAVACVETGDHSAARLFLQQALEINPANSRAVADLSNCLVAEGATGEAVELCQQFLAHYPGERLVVAGLALALHAQGDTEGARKLVDAQTLVQVFDIEATDSLVSVTELNDLLTELIRQDTSLLEDPVNKSTTGGAQTGEFDFAAHPPLAAFYELLCGAITEATGRYEAMGLGDHPLMAGSDEAQTLRAWGTLLRSGGRQSSHMHPLAWLSGVYYTHVPEDMTTGAANNPDKRAGWLEFNRPPDRFRNGTAPETWSYEPKPGRLIIFPSWFWHRTLPFASADERVSIAFDIVPVSAMRMF